MNTTKEREEEYCGKQRKKSGWDRREEVGSKWGRGRRQCTWGAHGSLLPATRGRVQHGNPIPRNGGLPRHPCGSPVDRSRKSRGTSLNGYFRPPAGHHCAPVGNKNHSTRPCAILRRACTRERERGRTPLGPGANTRRTSLSRPRCVFFFISLIPFSSILRSTLLFSSRGFSLRLCLPASVRLSIFVSPSRAAKPYQSGSTAR